MADNGHHGHSDTHYTVWVDGDFRPKRRIMVVHWVVSFLALLLLILFPQNELNVYRQSVGVRNTVLAYTVFQQCTHSTPVLIYFQPP